MSGLVRVDRDAGDVARLGQAQVAPGLAAVVGLVDAVAVRDVAADAGLARAGVDDVRIGVGDRDRADRGGEEAVRDVLPVRAAVGRLPDAAGAGAEVEGTDVGGMPGDGDAPPAAVRPDAAPLERAEQALVHQHAHGLTTVPRPRGTVRFRLRGGCFGGEVVASPVTWLLRQRGGCFACDVVASAARWLLRRRGGCFGGEVVASAARWLPGCASGPSVVRHL